MTKDLKLLLNNIDAFIKQASSTYAPTVNCKVEFFRAMTDTFNLAKNKQWRKYLFDTIKDHALVMLDATFDEKLDVDGNYIDCCTDPMLSPKLLARAIKSNVYKTTLKRLKYKYNNRILLDTLYECDKEGYGPKAVSILGEFFRKKDLMPLYKNDFIEIRKLFKNTVINTYNKTGLTYILNALDLPEEQTRILRAYIAANEYFGLKRPCASEDNASVQEILSLPFVDNKSDAYIDVIGNPEKQKEAFVAIRLHGADINTNTTSEQYINIIDMLVNIAK